MQKYLKYDDIFLEDVLKKCFLIFIVFITQFFAAQLYVSGDSEITISGNATIVIIKDNGNVEELTSSNSKKNKIVKTEVLEEEKEVLAIQKESRLVEKIKKDFAISKSKAPQYVFSKKHGKTKITTQQQKDAIGIVVLLHYDDLVAPSLYQNLFQLFFKDLTLSRFGWVSEDFLNDLNYSYSVRPPPLA